jgi:hypothetical protein
MNGKSHRHVCAHRTTLTRNVIVMLFTCAGQNLWGKAEQKQDEKLTLRCHTGAISFNDVYGIDQFF